MKNTAKNRIIRYSDLKNHSPFFNMDEYAVIPNPEFVFPPFEITPLSKKIKSLKNGLLAVVMDMDGTITTTELLCIHSLEYMMRKITGRMNKQQWSGLDHLKDYPHIIGNSTTKHVEYLVKKYSKYIIHDELVKTFFDSVIWTITIGKDPDRKNDALNTLSVSGCNELPDVQKPPFLKYSNLKKLSSEYYIKYKDKIKLNDFNSIVKAAVEIYYKRYHEILAALKDNKNIPESNILPSVSKNLIEPMPGAAFFLALIKGLTGNETTVLSNHITDEYEKKNPGITKKLKRTEVASQLKMLSMYFAENPVKTAVVTSSIFYEADIVMNELFRVFREQINKWRLSPSIKKNILDKFSSYSSYYDAVITASDSNEMRLKPHRDLYSLALHKLGIKPPDFDKVIGFEDSESGTIAIRSSGIKLCAAVPFAQTSGHNFSAASVILNGGLPEAIMKHNVFLKV